MLQLQDFAKQPVAGAEAPVPQEGGIFAACMQQEAAFLSGVGCHTSDTLCGILIYYFSGPHGPPDLIAELYFANKE